jgi:hypothetical protein
MLQYGIRAMFSTLSLNGLDKWSLDPRFQEEIVSGGPISNLRTFLSAKKLPWSCYEAQEEQRCHKTKTEVVLDRRVMWTLGSVREKENPSRPSDLVRWGGS